VSIIRSGHPAPVKSPLGAPGDLYQFVLDQGETLPDPASRWQPEGVHGPSKVIDPTHFPWSDQVWRRPAFRDLVIYEMHVGAFTAEGTFCAAIPKLSGLQECGVTAVELLPIADFAGDRNWGYDGVAIYAPSRAYGHPDDLRAFVDAAHHHGLAVILDVVYNHFGPDGNYLHAYIGEYLDEAKKTPWGGAIRYGDPRFKPLRDFVIANPTYWMREFHVDGFRLDATHEIFDPSPRHILQEITATIHAQGGYAIAEDSRNEAHLVMAEADSGFGFDAVWADDFHHSVRVANTSEHESYFGDFNGSVEETVRALSDGWIFQGQPTSAGNRVRGTPCRHLAPAAFVHCVSNHDQIGNHAFGERVGNRMTPEARRAADALLCLTPYTPMLFMGQEWAASTPFCFFTDHHESLGELIKAGRRNEFSHFSAFHDPAQLDKLPDPQAPATFQRSKLHWDERSLFPHASTLALYQTLLALRAEHQVFRPVGRDTCQASALLMGIGALRWFDAGTDWLLLFDLTGGHQGSLAQELFCRLRAGIWEKILSSNEARFGGNGTTALDLPTMTVRFDAPEAILLRAFPI
jgi:maltooligosyltrehalose trehalohydrolase